jgi:hypothetical protein
VAYMTGNVVFLGVSLQPSAHLSGLPRPSPSAGSSSGRSLAVASPPVCPADRAAGWSRPWPRRQSCSPSSRWSAAAV